MSPRNASAPSNLGLVASTGLIQVVAGGFVAQAFGVYAVAWTAAFGFDAVARSVAYGVFQSVSGFIAPMQGVLLNRHGARPVVRSGFACLAAGLAIISAAPSREILFLGLAVLSSGVGLAGFLSLSTALMARFPVNPAWALAAMNIGQALSGLVVTLVATAVALIGWRLTAVSSAVAIAFLAWPLTSRLSALTSSHRRTREPVAQHPSPEMPQQRRVRDSEFRRAFASSTFWLLTLPHAIAMMAVASILVHLVDFVHTKFGYGLGISAAAISVVAVANVLGQITTAGLGNRPSKRLLAAFAMVLHSLALLTVAVAGAPLPVFIAAAVHGFAWGIRGPLMLTLRAEEFGPELYPRIMGASVPFVAAGSIAGPVVVGVIATTSGSVEIGFAVLGLLCLLGGVMLAVSPNRRRSSTPGRP